MGAKCNRRENRELVSRINSPDIKIGISLCVTQALRLTQYGVILKSLFPDLA